MRILVIRLGALGDFILSFPAFAAIRARHPDAHITLLTTAPFVELARRAPWFDAVRLDRRPKWWNLAGVLGVAGALRNFDFVYDLQTSRRSSRYFILANRPPWSGIAAGCSHPHANPGRDFLHTRERQREQLEMAGVSQFPPPDTGWLTAAAGNFPVPDPFALMVPGASPRHPEKRWPAERFGALAALLAARGISSVVLGGEAEAPLAGVIRAACPESVDLTGQTTLADIAGLAARARFAVGNDTGPMHLIAAMGCPSVVLFSAASDPALTAPRGPDGAWPVVLRAPVLADLDLERVAAALPIGS
jgi:ADP-heptose:LPS heptosyltransferase